MKQLLFYSQDIRIISDNPNKLGFENFPEFKENRHDQTALSLIIRKLGEANSGNLILNQNGINSQKNIYFIDNLMF